MWQTVLAGFVAAIAPAIGQAAAAIVQAILAKILARLGGSLPAPSGDAAADQRTMLDAGIAALRPRQVFKRAALRHLRAVVPDATAAGREPSKAELADVPVHLRMAAAAGE